jgi:lipopolysaccharide transport system ATP-binding protein
MSEIVIRVEGLSKQYRIGAQREPYLTLRDSIAQWSARLVGALSGRRREEPDGTLFWALRDVSFEVKHGEVLGIIGPNGAGKSTLLKILSRITEPTAGRVEIHGRVGSLLEVGTGFHAELTGRENIYLNGAILGMRKAEIDRKFDAIVAFADLGRFIDTPVKRYSSGMYVRLAFAVAAHLEPEILVVDEVLAVGDAEFQRKCLGKMQDVASTGRTVLFVSHNMGSIQRLCSRGILLNAGVITMNGSVEKAVSEYLALGMSRLGERVWSDLATAPGNDVVRLLGMRCRNARGEVCSQFDVRDPVALEIEYAVLREGSQVCSVVEFLNALTQNLMVSFDDYVAGTWGKQGPGPTGVFRSTCLVPGDLFTEGDISINLRIFSPPDRPNDNPYVRELDVARFRVTDVMAPGGVRGSYPFEWGGPALRPRLSWVTERRPLEEAGLEARAAGRR